jgi:hypothetical protein
MSSAALASVVCIHTSLPRALTWPNGTHERHRGWLCDTAAYGNHGTTRKSPQVSNFGGNNHKRVQPHLVTIEYRNADVCYGPEDFPSVKTPDAWPQSVGPHESRNFDLPTVERAKRYLSSVAPAIAGQHGDLHTFRICCRLARGFALDDDHALHVLAEWNARCQPPWSPEELLDKLRRAARYGREPIGGQL